VAKSETLERDTTAKIVAERLREEIQVGTIAPGTHLRQNELAKRFGVSTTPVREAFAQLQAEGLLRIDPHRGAVVFHPTVEDLLQFYEMREVLESLAIRHALPKLTPEVTARLRELIKEMHETEDPRRWLALNDDFHLRLYECAGRPRLSALIENIRDASTPYIHMFVASRPRSKRANHEHEAILDACVNEGEEAAERQIRSHLRGAAEELARFLGSDGEGASTRWPVDA
jgi:DNA-binding GntR family transcriptional regulator